MTKKIIFKKRKKINKSFIFILLSICLFTLTPIDKTISSENTYIINNVKSEGKIDLNFTREKHLEKAFLNSFEILMKKILLSKDLQKTKNIKLNQIKTLISSFQIIEEKYSKDKYNINIGAAASSA